jgi:phosphate transport system substrate-binding protein
MKGTQAVKNSLLKRSVIAGAAITASFATFGVVLPANAAVVTPAAISPIQITITGSDTTQFVMGAIAGATTTSGVNYTNVDAYVASTVTVAADDNCTGVSFYPTGTTGLTGNNQVAPAGSGAGRTALKNFVAGTTYGADNKGCVDIARSSGFTSGSPAASTGEYYAFALDAVSWATASQFAPATMTQAQLQGIYNCTYTDWSQVGGSAGQIIRYLPPTTSGTENFFKSDVLGSSAFSYGTSQNDPTLANYCPDIRRTDRNGDPFEENRGNKIPDEDWQKAILPYSAGQWVYQANNAVNPTIDFRRINNGGATVRLGGLNASSGGAKTNNANAAAWNRSDAAWQLNDSGLSIVQTGDPGGYVVVEGNAKGSTPTFPGVRFVYNVLDTRSPNYTQARAFVGFDNVASGTKSALCSGTRASIISSYGFSPLPSSGNVGNNNDAGSTCRKFIA